MPITAAIAAPNGIPQYIAPTAVPRCRGPAASEHSAIRFGIAAPSPQPVINRATSRLSKLQTCVVASENRPNIATDHISTRLRPNRSASRPPSAAPGSRPSAPALNAQPICATASENSFAMRGPATPADCRSSPSSNAIARHNMIVACPVRPCRAVSPSVRDVFIQSLQ